MPAIYSHTDTHTETERDCTYVCYCLATVHTDMPSYTHVSRYRQETAPVCMNALYCIVWRTYSVYSYRKPHQPPHSDTYILFTPSVMYVCTYVRTYVQWCLFKQMDGADSAAVRCGVCSVHSTECQTRVWDYATQLHRAGCWDRQYIVKLSRVTHALSAPTSASNLAFSFNSLLFLVCI